MDYFEKPKVFPPLEVEKITPVGKPEKKDNLGEHSSPQNKKNGHRETLEEIEKRRKKAEEDKIRKNNQEKRGQKFDTYA